MLAPGRVGTYTLALDSEPSHPVTVALTTNGPQWVSMRPSTLTFDASNWHAPQAVTVTMTTENAQGTSIAHTVSSEDVDYDGYALPRMYVRVPDPFGLSVANARTVAEAPGATLTFEVTLDEAAAIAVTADYATVDHTAVAGEDYVATSGTLTFAVGETRKSVTVTVLDDAVDEGIEQFRLRVFNTSGVENPYPAPGRTGRKLDRRAGRRRAFRAPSRARCAP